MGKKLSVYQLSCPSPEESTILVDNIQSVKKIRKIISLKLQASIQLNMQVP